MSEHDDAVMFDGILAEVLAEAERSIAKHGDQRNIPMGTGPNVLPLDLGTPVYRQFSAGRLADLATQATDSRSFSKGDGTVTWRDILTEEVFEAYAEDDPAALRAELIQVAAVAVKMIDAIDHTPSA